MVDAAGAVLEIVDGVVLVGDQRFEVDCTGNVAWTDWSCEAGVVRLELSAKTDVSAEVDGELRGEDWTLVTVDPQRPAWSPQCDGGAEGCPPACIWGELNIESGVAAD